MRKLIVVAGLLAVIVAISAVFATKDTATVEAEGISVNENGELVLPQAAQTFLAFMNGAQEVPEVITDTTGLAVVLMNDDFSEASFALKVDKGVAITQAHIHCGDIGEDGPVAAFLSGDVPGGHNVNGWWILNSALTDANIVDNPCVNNLQELASEMANLGMYVNVHSVANGGGEIRGQLFMLPSTIDSDITSFNLEDLSVSTGTTVKWTNQAGLPHTTTEGVPGAQSGWDSGLLARGQSFSQTFDSPGVFPYFCTIHQWMTGTVTVSG